MKMKWFQKHYKCCMCSSIVHEARELKAGQLNRLSVPVWEMLFDDKGMPVGLSPDRGKWFGQYDSTVHVCDACCRKYIRRCNCGLGGILRSEEWKKLAADDQARAEARLKKKVAEWNKQHKEKQ